jgi:VWFA-related protein
MITLREIASHLATFAIAVSMTGAAMGQPQMVRLNVAAFDAHGQAVGDLTQSDFSIQDAGKEQAIAFFHPAGHSTGTISHATVVLFDLLNADFTNRSFASDEIVHSLQGRETSDFLYFYLLTPDIKLQPVRGLPNSAADIKPAAAPWTRSIRALLDESLKNANRLRQSGLVEDERVRRTYEALTQVVSTIALIPGRKNIVWISRGVPISLRLAGGGDAIDYKPLVRKLSEACARAKVSVYTVNPATSAVPSEADLANVETLQQIANLTGGRMYTANSIGQAVTQAAEEWLGDYTVGYFPAADSWDGKQHKVKVSSGRRGVALLYPDAYYADRPDASAVMRSALQAAISSPFDSSEMHLRVTAAKGKAAGSAHFQIRVDYSDALVTAKDNRFSANLVLTIVDYTAQGPKAIAPPTALNATMTEEQRAAAGKDGVLLTEDRAVGDGVERMRIIVYDPATGLLGSATVPVNKLE